jgi:hypothetical protein
MTPADRNSAEKNRADDRLKALFALDEPAARDPVFATEVMARVMRRRFQEEVALLSGATVVGGVAFWAIWPVLQPVLVTISQGFAPALGAIALAGCALVIVGGRVRTALGLAS